MVKAGDFPGVLQVVKMSSLGETVGASGGFTEFVGGRADY